MEDPEKEPIPNSPPKRPGDPIPKPPLKHPPNHPGDPIPGDPKDPQPPGKRPIPTTRAS